MAEAVSCTGNRYCSFALIPTKTTAQTVVEELERRLELPHAVRSHWTGCPNACGQPYMGEIGLMGAKARHEGQMVEAVKIFLGGDMGADPKLAELHDKGVPLTLLPDVLEQLRAQGCDRILVLPAYPQYSGTTTASVFDALFQHLSKVRNVPELRLIRHYHDDPGYINALADTVRLHWSQHGRPDKLVMSFHGVPKRTLLLGDPYHCECHKTARLLAERLGISKSDYVVTVQSRFGRAEWLQPYTAPTLEQLAGSGVGRVDLICPGFTSDCLETLEEIAMEAKEDFLAAGGKSFHYIPCLNESPSWIAGMAALIEAHTGGWPVSSSPQVQAARQADADVGREQALALGALD
jgi:ferrochelatase